MAQLSPMMQQYERIKSKHQDKILFFRLGDFYEMFFDDALVASKELELTLTGRDCGLDERAPMCGVPYHSAEGYIARLLEFGHKVAICEQTSDPSAAKGIVERDVVRVITRGTALESSMLSEEKNNFLCSIYADKTSAGICFSDISCGILYVSEIEKDNLVADITSELSRFSPAEVLICKSLLSYPDLAAYVKEKLPCSVELLEEDTYDDENVENLLTEQFASDAKEHMQYNVSACAVAGLLSYLKETQKQYLKNLTHVERYDINSYMRLSELTRTHLEITRTMRSGDKKGSLLSVLDNTKTAMGHRLLRLWVEQPLQSDSMINRRLDAVAELIEQQEPLLKLIETLKEVKDFERTLSRIVCKTVAPRELFAFGEALSLLPSLKNGLSSFVSPEILALKSLLDPLGDVKILIENALSEKDLPTTLKDGNVIKNGYDAEIDELRALSNGAKEKLSELEASYKQEYNIKNLKIRYNRVFGYYIEVSKSQTDAVPDSFIRRQTLANAERYVTEELKDLENKIMGASERLLRREAELYTQLLDNVTAHSARISASAASVAKLDVFCSFAHTASMYDYCRPVVDKSSLVLIENGRHPVVERQMKSMSFVPNDSKIDSAKERILLITGPNMAGKSTFMRQTALIVLMSHLGCYVPAQSAHIGICDSICTRVGASDDLSAGQSTFMVEMTEMADILKTATSRSLLILDEIGRGTSTFDGLSIARAIVEYLAEGTSGVKPKTMFATHYHELCSLEQSFFGIKNYSITAKKRGGQLIFLRKIVNKAADDSYGIDVAKLAGIPESIIKRANEILVELEEHSDLLSGAARQISFDENEDDKNQKSTTDNIIGKLKNCAPNTLSPLEAWQMLAELKALAEDD